MTEQELEQRRKTKWHADGNAVRTLEAAREFIESAGLCLMYPLKPPLLLPTFIGAYTGSSEGLPTRQQAFADARATEATELMVRLLRVRAAYEAKVFGDNTLLVAASVFAFVYALLGDRNPKQEVTETGRGKKLSPLARDAFHAIRQHGPVSKTRLQELLAGGVSGAALDRALSELWSVLKITRVDYHSREGASWDTLYRWAPEAVEEGVRLSVGEALSALLSKYLDCVVAAEPREVEELFSHLAPRSRVREAVNALLAARQLSFVPVGKRTMIEVAPVAAAGNKPGRRAGL